MKLAISFLQDRGQTKLRFGKKTFEYRFRMANNWIILADPKCFPRLYCEATSEAGITGFEKAKSADSFSMAKYVRPLILRSPENLYLIAETRTFITGFSDAVAQCGKMVDHVLQVMDDSLLTCMVPYYTNLLLSLIHI